MYTIRFYSFLMHNSPIIDYDQRPSVHPFLYFILTLLNNSTSVFRESDIILSEQNNNVKHFFKLFLIILQNTLFFLIFQQDMVDFIYQNALLGGQFYTKVLVLSLYLFSKENIFHSVSLAVLSDRQQLRYFRPQ